MDWIRRLPLWVRYAVAISVAGILFALLVIYVSSNQQPLSEQAATANKSQQAQENKEDLVLVEQQQAPHVVKLTHSSAGASAAAAVTAFMANQVSHAFITGPLDKAASCTSAGGSHSEPAFHCNAIAGRGEDSLRYPFDVVVATAAKTVTYCQVVTSPDPSLPSPPVSARCR